MARIAFPASLNLTRFNLRPRIVGQRTIQHRFANKQTVISRGSRGWEGEFTVTPRGGTRAQIAAKGKALAKWLWDMQGSENTCLMELPSGLWGNPTVLQYHTDNPGNWRRNNRFSIENGKLVAKSAGLTYAGFFELLAGDFITCTRLYKIVRLFTPADGFSRMELDPPILPPGWQGADNITPVDFYYVKPRVEIRLTGNQEFTYSGIFPQETTIRFVESPTTG